MCVNALVSASGYPPPGVKVYCTAPYPKLDKTRTMVKPYHVLFYTDLVFTTIFAVEMVLKIVAYGFLYPRVARANEPPAYLRSGWNRLDFVIVLLGFVSLSIQSRSLASLKSLRTLRALRPLRMVRSPPSPLNDDIV
eukprot:1182511-Prorocentrum_minimum.AAC.4